MKIFSRITREHCKGDPGRLGFEYPTRKCDIQTVFYAVRFFFLLRLQTQEWPALNGCSQDAPKLATGSKFQQIVKLEMREVSGDWWHFLSIPADQVSDELEQWRENNPDHEFRELPISG